MSNYIDSVIIGGEQRHIQVTTQRVIGPDGNPLSEILSHVPNTDTLKDYALKSELDNLDKKIPTDYITKTELNNKGYSTNADIQNLKKEINNNITSANNRIAILENINHNSFLTEHQSLDGYYTKEQVNSIIDSLTKVSLNGTILTVGNVSVDLGNLTPNSTPCPIISINSGIYTEAQQVNIIIPEGYELIYTLDGTIPSTINGLKTNQNVSLNIDNNTIIQARLLKDGIMSEVVTSDIKIISGETYAYYTGLIESINNANFANVNLQEYATGYNDLTTETILSNPDVYKTYFIMIPENTNGKVTFQMGQNASTDDPSWTCSELIQADDWKAKHSPVEINGIIYNVYGYRDQFADYKKIIFTLNA